jgi:digeranylgeranylglycerophospholipid reductase
LFDVIIIGGGPIGSYAAGRLARLGYKVMVLERKQSIDEKVCCTGIVGQECVSSFAIDETVILRQANSAKLFSPTGSLLKLWREETQACILDRPAFNVAMAKRAQDMGAEYILDCWVTNVDIGDSRARVETSLHKKGFTFESRAVVIATGFGPALTERLGLGKANDFVIGVQADVETTGTDEVEVYFGREIAPGFFGWLVPTSPQTARVGLLSRKNPEFYSRKLLTSLFAQGKIVTPEVKLGYGGIPLKPLYRTYHERLVVVGDAAGQVKPTSGGGIFWGLLCADIAANTLHEALQHDDLTARSLAKYERDWRRKLGWEMKTGYWARKLFERLSDNQIDRIFDVVKANGIDEVLLKAKDLSFDWHGKTILAILGRTIVSRTIGMVKTPSRINSS